MVMIYVTQQPENFNIADENPTVILKTDINISSLLTLRRAMIQHCKCFTDTDFFFQGKMESFISHPPQITCPDTRQVFLMVRHKVHDLFIYLFRTHHSQKTASGTCMRFLFSFWMGYLYIYIIIMFFSVIYQTFLKQNAQSIYFHENVFIK